MRILGHTALRAKTEDVCLGQTEDGESLVVRLTAPRLGFLARINDELPDPTPPIVGVKRRADGTVEKDAEGRPLQISNTDDPAHKKAVEAVGRMRTVAIILECLGDQVEVAARERDYGTRAQYMQAVWDEMEEFGFTLGALEKLTRAAMRLAGVGDDEVAAAKEALGAGPGSG